MKKILTISIIGLVGAGGGCFPTFSENLSSEDGNQLMVDEAPLFHGTVYGSKLWTSDEDREADMGLYRFFGEENLELKRIIKSKDFYLESGMYLNGLYYTMTNDLEDGFPVGNRYIVYDTEDWSVQSGPVEIEDPANLAGSISYDPTSGKIYGFFANPWSGAFTEYGSFDKEACKYTPIKEYLLAPVVLSSINSKGEMYGVDAKGDLYRIEKETGEMTLIGYTGVTPRFSQSAAFDYRTDKLYWYACTHANELGLYEVNTETAETVRISKDMDYQLTGIYIENPVYGAPGWVDDACFKKTEDAGTSGTLKLKMPLQTVDGKSLEGSLSLRIAVEGGDSILIDNLSPGQNVTQQLDLPEGLARMSLTAKNDVGYGLQARFKIWMGVDVPLAVSDLQIEKVDGKASLSWTAPSGGVNGGFVDAGNVRYNVVRNDGKVVAENLTETAFVDESAGESVAYTYYTVTAINSAGQSESMQTSAMVFGEPVLLPYAESFAGGNIGNGWFELNMSNDAACWSVETKGTYPDASSFDGDNGLLTFNCHSKDVPAGTESRFISPAIVLGDKEQFLNFALYHHTGRFITDDYVLAEVVREDGSIEPLGDPVKRSDGDKEGWYIHSFSLDKYKGESPICIALRGVSDYGDNIHVDNITVQDVSGVASPDVASVLVTGGRSIRVMAESVLDIRIYNVSGQMMKQCEAQTLDFEAPRGFYVVVAGGHPYKVLVE